jgi:hypothetical protein
MRQRALQTGYLSNPFKEVVPGEEFEHHEEMVWAEVIEPEPEPSKDVAAKKGSKAKAEPPDVI